MTLKTENAQFFDGSSLFLCIYQNFIFTYQHKIAFFQIHYFFSLFYCLNSQNKSQYLSKDFEIKICSWNEKYKCTQSVCSGSQPNVGRCWLRLLAKVTTEKGQDVKNGDDLPVDSNNQGRRYRWLNSRNGQMPPLIFWCLLRISLRIPSRYIFLLGKS